MISLIKNKQNYRFIIVGTSGFLFNSCLLLILNSHFRIEKIISEVIAMIFSLQLTFILHDRWTYKDGNYKSTHYHWSLKKRYTTYLFSNSFSSVLTIFLFAVFSIFLPRIIGLGIAALISMCWNFLMNKIMIWKHKIDET
jgi:putative flippase GtrA